MKLNDSMNLNEVKLEIYQHGTRLLAFKRLNAFDIYIQLTVQFSVLTVLTVIVPTSFNRIDFSHWL